MIIYKPQFPDDPTSLFNDLYPTLILKVFKNIEELTKMQLNQPLLHRKEVNHAEKLKS